MTELEHQTRAKSGVGVVLGWDIDRRYTSKEISSSELFRLIPRNGFLPTGEECGTEYDFANVCPICGAGRSQRYELVLDLRNLPKKSGKAVSLGGEIVVSQKTAEIMVDHKLTGFSLKPTRHRTSKFTGPRELESVPAGREVLLDAARVGISSHGAAFHVWLNRSDQIKLLLDKARLEAGLSRDRRLNDKPLPVGPTPPRGEHCPSL